MPARSRTILIWMPLVLAISDLRGGPSAQAQGLAPGGSLGGYGAASSVGNPAMGGGGAMVIPYGGMTEGFMPGRIGGSSSLSFRSRSTAAMSPSRTSFSLSPMSGGMSSTAGGSRSVTGGMGRGLGARSSMTGFSGAGGGMGLGGSSFRLGSGGGVMPTGIGYPFRQPPSLLTPSSIGAGMSM